MPDSRKLGDSPKPIQQQLDVRQVGIWRLGDTIHCSRSCVVAESQPIDADHGPRWDYVAKIGISDASRQAIERSIACGSEVSHPNIVPVLDGNPAAPMPYLVMPKLNGRTMQCRLDDETQNPLPVALWIVRQTCQALQAVHAAGWTHGDIKPTNLMVGENGHVTLLDFGFARRGTLPATSSYEGTPAYAAPEVTVNASMVSPASDLFAVGRILWQWLTRVKTTNEVMLSPVCELVEQLVQPSPSDRPTARETAQTLLRLEIDSLGQYLGTKLDQRAA